MHQSVTFDSHFALGIEPSDITSSLYLTARAKQWTMHPVPHPPTGYLAKGTKCLAYFSLLYGNGAYQWNTKVLEINKQTDFLEKDYNKYNNNNQLKKCDVD